jgi:ApbE superfamily uncharacterized protein (UPF0280 family)
MYQPRSYRNEIKDGDLVSFTVTVKETDLYVRAGRDLTTQARSAVHEVRSALEEYIREHPLFLHSLAPVEVKNGVAEVVRVMAEAARLANVGPMAAVAGAVAEMVGRKLLAFSPEVIVENGGDIFLKVGSKRQIGIYAGDSAFTGRLAIEVEAGQTPLGICTSSGTVGPSLSLGLADAAIILAPSAALADAAATAVGNVVKGEQDIDAAIELGKKIRGVTGIVVIVGGSMGAWGDIKLVKT